VRDSRAMIEANRRSTATPTRSFRSWWRRPRSARGGRICLGPAHKNCIWSVNRLRAHAAPSGRSTTTSPMATSTPQKRRSTTSSTRSRGERLRAGGRRHINGCRIEQVPPHPESRAKRASRRTRAATWRPHGSRRAASPRSSHEAGQPKVFGEPLNVNVPLPAGAVPWSRSHPPRQNGPFANMYDTAVSRRGVGAVLQGRIRPPLCGAARQDARAQARLP